MGREFAVQAGIHKRFFEHVVCRLPVHRDGPFLVSRWEQRTRRGNHRFVFLPVPVDQLRDCVSAVNVHWHGS